MLWPPVNASNSPGGDSFFVTVQRHYKCCSLLPGQHPDKICLEIDQYLHTRASLPSGISSVRGTLEIMRLGDRKVEEDWCLEGWDTLDLGPPKDDLARGPPPLEGSSLVRMLNWLGILDVFCVEECCV